MVAKEIDDAVQSLGKWLAVLLLTQENRTTGVVLQVTLSTAREDRAPNLPLYKVTYIYTREDLATLRKELSQIEELGLRHLVEKTLDTRSGSGH